MKQNSGLYNSNTPQFSSSWKPHFTASNLGHLRSHYQKKMQKVEEFVCIFKPISELTHKELGFVKLPQTSSLFCNDAGKRTFLKKSRIFTSV